MKKRKKKDNDGVHSTELEDASVSRKGKKERKEKKNSTSLTTPILATSDGLSSPCKISSTKPNYTFSLSPATVSPSEAKAFLEKHSVTLHTPEGEPSITPVIKFSQLDVPPEIQSAFAGFKEPTPIQACSWPPALNGKDVVGIAETGRSVSARGCIVLENIIDF